MTVRAALSWVVWPAALTVWMGGAAFALQHGVAEGLVVAAASLAGAVLVATLERVLPYEGSWNRSRGDVGTDVLHTLVSMVGVPEVLKALTFGGIAAASVSLSATAGTGLWPTGWSLLAQAVLALVVGEFPQYWVHRLGHEWPVLWRLHSVHHSAPRLYWLNAGRFHPLDTALQYFATTALLVLLGCPSPVIALYLVFTSLHGLFQHGNVDIRLGFQTWIFSLSLLHRWHHSRTIVESNTNYGANLIVWDVVFGTRFLPVDRSPPADIGIADMPDFPTGWWGQVTAPFRWRRLPRVDPADAPRG